MVGCDEREASGSHAKRQNNQPMQSNKKSNQPMQQNTSVCILHGGSIANGHKAFVALEATKATINYGKKINTTINLALASLVPAFSGIECLWKVVSQCFWKMASLWKQNKKSFKAARKNNWLVWWHGASAPVAYSMALHLLQKQKSDNQQRHQEETQQSAWH